MSELVVRRAEASDAEAFARIFGGRLAAAGTLQTPYPSVAQWKERLSADPGKNFVFVALAGAEVVGNAGLHSAGNTRRAHAYSVGIVVRDDWQGRGVGTRLMETLVDLADNWLGALRLELTVFCDNEPALRLYRRFGFEIEGTHRAFALREGRLADTYAMARLHPRPPMLPGPSGREGT